MAKVRIFLKDLSEEKQKQIRDQVKEIEIMNWCIDNNIDFSDFYEPELSLDQITDIDTRINAYIGTNDIGLDFEI